MNVLALILAGGTGTRLGVLTETLAKPSVYFGGKYRIIDFALSNCAHSQLEGIAILPQYRPVELISHVAMGRPWDFARRTSYFAVLPPHKEWYQGTADAVFQNIEYIDYLKPDTVLVLSADHVYLMDYRPLLKYMDLKNARAVLAATTVPWEEASRYGTVITDEHERIMEFQEKPAEPKSNLVNMGIYAFKWHYLRDLLLEDSVREESSHDFGADIWPRVVGSGEPAYAYRFDGYWLDVGTIKSFWEGHMDLVAPFPRLNLYDPRWKIYTNPADLPSPIFLGSGSARSALVSEGSVVKGNLLRSVVGLQTFIDDDAEVVESVIGPRSYVGKGAKLYRVITGESVCIEEGVVIGEGEDLPNEVAPQIYTDGITVIGRNASIVKGSHLGRQVAVQEGAVVNGVYGSGAFIYRQ
ncbi:glucose-1-phosphate adenylyltransferase family protein [Coprothermobacter proteolyticus]|uniref:glucose-1-phosphate adenylyltransferase family protein n=1 Tax=Coprothermobacter proteolyticus TaxID=35786 RepID=UPI000D30C98D|nr:sugar phosphate nucleotidyltransferase [Coprothermobacter proteolyticus]